MLTTPHETNAQEDYPALIPLPEKVEWLAGKFLLSNSTSVTAEDDKLREYFISQVKEFTGLTLTSKSNTQNRIILIIDNKLDQSNKEAYKLAVSEKQIEITGASEQGLFIGMQTFFQLIPPSVKTLKDRNAVEIPSCNIVDKPKFSWRGLHLDCCRHFMTKDFIKRYIDIMAYYKFNTFHWRLVEDQGWRIEIKKYPKLTEVGAWRKEADGTIYGGYYTQEDIKEVVEYAKSRYINIVPEIEMPGHTLASLAAYPQYSCAGGPFEVSNIWGVHKDIYCAGNDSTFYFLQDVLDEVTNLFPGEYIHIGGDEAPKDRWKECPKCQARIKSEGLKDEHELQGYFTKRVAGYLASKGKKVIGWDEVLQGGLANGMIVQSWQSFQGAIDAAKLGHYTICSPASHTYLDHDPEDFDLRIAYSFIPAPDELTAEEKKYVIGSEANLWTEETPQETVDGEIFPRLLALAEVFWNDPHNKDYDEFYLRVQKTYADLTAYGIKFGRESKLFTTSTIFDETKKEFTVNIKQGQKEIEIRYTEDGSEPDIYSKLYTEPIKINKSISLKIAAFKENHFIGKRYNLSFDFHKALNSKIMLASKYDERYRASGENGLIDGVRATNNHRDGCWQGFEGIDFESVIDLGTEKEISKVIPRFLLHSNGWIFLPNKVEITLSKDNVNYSKAAIIVNDVPQKNSEILFKDFVAEFDKQTARYIKVKAESIKKCPSWHPGAGGNAWLFIDEIVVE